MITYPTPEPKEMTPEARERQLATWLRVAMMEMGAYPLAPGDPESARAELLESIADLSAEELRVVAYVARLLARHPDPDFFAKAMKLQGDEAISVVNTRLRPERLLAQVKCIDRFAEPSTLSIALNELTQMRGRQGADFSKAGYDQVVTSFLAPPPNRNHLKPGSDSQAFNGTQS